MNSTTKRIVLVGVAAIAGAAVMFSTGLNPFQSGLPAASPQTAKAAATTTVPTQPTPAPEVARAQERAADLQKRLAENPRDQAALSEVVDGLMAAKRYAQAADLLNQALEAGSDVPRLRIGLGLALFYQGIPSMSQRELKRAIELNPDLAEAHFYYALTMSHGSRMDLDAARAAWEKVVQLDPDGDLGRQARQYLAQPGAAGK